MDRDIETKVGEVPTSDEPLREEWNAIDYASRLTSGEFDGNLRDLFNRLSLDQLSELARILSNK